MKKVVTITGMSCEHCQQRVINALSDLSGVTEVTVNLENGTAEFSAPDSLSDECITETIDDAGYDVVKIV